MTTTTTAPKEVKLNTGYGNPASRGKEFGFGEIEGLKLVFQRLEASNLKRSGKVDYWLNKNHKVLGKAWEEYMQSEWDLLKEYAEIIEKDGVEYLVHKGKDENDLVYFSGGAMYKLEGEKFVLTYNPLWKLEIPAAEEGGEPTFKDMQYTIKYKTDTAPAEFEQALFKLREEYKVSIELWPLKEEHLEGLNVVWKDVRNDKDGKPYVESDATVFRSLLYDNCIVA